MLHKFLLHQPAFAKQEMMEEIPRLKNKILKGFQSALDLSRSELKNSEEESCFFHTLNESISLFNKYISLEYSFSIEERIEILDLTLPFLVEEKFGGIGFIEIRTKIAELLYTLLKQRKVVSGMQNSPSMKAITCWKRLYELIRQSFFKKQRQVDYGVPSNPELFIKYGLSLIKAICKLRNFFPTTATKEILDTFTGRMSVYHTEYYISLCCLCLFLPTSFRAVDYLQGKCNYWIDHLIELWNSTTSNSPLIEVNFFSLFYRMSRDRCGDIQIFQPHLDDIFSEILRCMDVPVKITVSALSNKMGVKLSVENQDDNSVSRLYRLASSTGADPPEACNLFWSDSPKGIALKYAAQLCVYLLDFPETLQFLSQLVHSVDDQFLWNSNLIAFMHELIRALTKRLKREQASTSTMQLSPKVVDEIVDMVFSVSKAILFSEDVEIWIVDIEVMKHLCFIRPKRIIASIFEIIQNSLQNFSKANQISTTIELLNVVLIPLLSRCDEVPEIREYLSQVLMTIVLNIEITDNMKAIRAYEFLSRVFQLVPIIESSNANETPSAVSLFEDFAIEFVNRTLEFLSNVTYTDLSKNYYRVMISVSLFFQQLSPRLHKLCFQKIVLYLTTNFLPDCSKQFRDLIHYASSYYCDHYNPMTIVISELVPKVIRSDNNMTDKELSYYLKIVGKSFKNNNNAIHHANIVRQIIDVHLNRMKKEVDLSIITAIGKLVRHYIESLTTVYLLEKRSVPFSTWNSSSFMKTNHFLHWGKLVDLNSETEIEAKWHIPRSEELIEAGLIYDICMDLIMTKLDNRCIDETDDLLTTLTLLRYVMKGSSMMLDEIPENAEQSTKFFSTIASSKYSRLDIAKKLSLILKEFTSRMNTSTLTEHKSTDNTDIITSLIDLIQICIVYRRMNYTSTRENTTQLWNAIKMYYFKSLNRKHHYPRAAVLDRILILYKWREALQRTKCCLHEKYFSEVHATLLNDLFHLATTSEYENIREKAKICFFKISNLFKRSHRKLLDPYISTCISTLTDPSCTNKYQVIGCIEFLSSLNVIKTICRSWLQVSRCFHTLDPKSEHDTFPHEYLRLIAKCMISENTNLRMLSLSTMNRVLLQLKPHQPFQILNNSDTIKSLIEHRVDACSCSAMIDKPYHYATGYLSDVNGVLSFLPNELKVYDYSMQLQPSSFYISLEVIQRLMNDTAWWKQFFDYATDGDTSTTPTFRMQMAFFFKGLCQVIGPKIIDIFNTFWDSILSISNDDPSLDFVIRMSSEIFTGCVRGSKHWQAQVRRKLFGLLLPKLERMVGLSSHNSCNLIVSHALAHCVRDLDYRRNKELIDFLISSLDLGNADTLLQTKILNLTFHVLANCGAIKHWYQHLVDYKLIPFLRHTHFSIRELIGSTIGLGFLDKYHFRISSDVGSCQEKDPYLVSILQTFASQLDNPQSEEQFEYVCSVFVECVIRTMIRAPNILTPYLSSIFTILLSNINNSHSNEMTLQASIVCAKIATIINRQAVDSIYTLSLNTIQQTPLHKSDSTDTWKGMTLLSFIGNFTFKNQFYIFKYDESYQTLCDAYLSCLLKDKNMLIRQLASDMLCPLLKIMPNKMLLTFSKLFLTQAKALLDSSTTQKKDEDPVYVGLGLSSIVKAFSHSYDIPTFLPNVMEHLARMNKFSTGVQGQLLQQIIRETFDIFFRLQQSIDRWEQNKTKFTQQQLEYVSEVLYSPSHYA